MQPTDGPGIAKQETPINIGALLDAYEEDIICLILYPFAEFIKGHLSPGRIGCLYWRKEQKAVLHFFRPGDEMAALRRFAGEQP